MTARLRGRRAICVVATFAVAVTGGAFAGAAEPAPARATSFDVLVFSRTMTFRHASIPPGIQAIRELGAENDFGVEATEDPAQFKPRNLKRFAAVIFLNTTGDVLDKPQQRALRRYLKRRGGAYVGIHSAADTEHDWPLYGRIVGAWFKSHPIQQTADFVNEAPTHPATAHLDARFNVFDEFYSFKSNPRPDVRVLLTIDESTYDPDPNTTHLPGNTPSSGVMGDHPMSWCHDNLNGRVFYTALGHENYLYELDWYRRHLLGGILTATKRVPVSCRPA